MRRTLRADRALGYVRALATPTTSFTCAACRHAAPFSVRATSRAVLDTEKWRKKIWGTDKPPGAADPYGGPSAAEKYKAEKEGKPVAAAEEAVTPAEEEWDMSTYEPADSWVGLEEVGGKGIWWSGRQEPEFEGYIPMHKVTDPYELTAALHRTVVEVFALRAANLPLAELSIAGVGPDLTTEVQIVAADEGGELRLPENITLEAITESLEQVDETAVKTNPTESEADVAADRSSVDLLIKPEVQAKLEEAIAKGKPTDSEADVAADRSDIDPMFPQKFQTLVEKWDPLWLNISLLDPEVKFAVVKRILQLTGIRVADSDISATRTVSDLLGHLATPPKPRRVIEALAQKEELFNLPNVKVYGRRVTPIDKEKSVGRWKVIEKELQARGLPVTGHE